MSWGEFRAHWYPTAAVHTLVGWLVVSPASRLRLGSLRCGVLFVSERVCIVWVFGRGIVRKHVGEAVEELADFSLDYVVSTAAVA